MIFKFNENLAKHIVIRQKILLGTILIMMTMMNI